MYVLTLCPTTYTEDAGEYITAPYVTGVVHPPGYPLYCMAGKLFTFIPYGSIAWRVNFMSAFWGAAAAFILFLLINRLVKKPEIAFASSMLFCFSDIFWSQCVVAEVYSLNVFFLALCLYLLCLWNENKKDKYLYMASFIYGLSLCNHHFMLLAGPFFILFALWNDFSILKRPALIFGCIGLFISGLLPYLYLPIASKLNPALDFGKPETLSRFLAHIRRQVYNCDYTGHDYGILEKKIFVKAFLIQLKEQFGVFFIIIGILGAWNFCRKHLKFFTISFGIFIFNSIGLLILLGWFPANIDNIETVSVYYFPCYLVFAIYIAFGILFLHDLIKNTLKGHRIAETIFKIIILSLAIIPIFSNYYKNNFSKNYYAYDFVKSAIDLTDKNAMLFTFGDVVTFNLFYFQDVEKYRGDIETYDFNDCFSRGYFGREFNINYKDEEINKKTRIKVFNEIVEKNYGKRPIYFTYDFDMGKESKYTLAPYGIIYRVVKKGEKASFKEDPLLKIHIRNLNDPSVYRDYRVREMLCFYWQALAAYYESVKNIKDASACNDKMYDLGIPAALNNIGLKFYREGNLNEALRFYSKARDIDPYQAELNFNLGRLYEKTGNKELAIKNYEEFIKKWRGDPRYVEYAKAVIKLMNSR